MNPCSEIERLKTSHIIFYVRVEPRSDLVKSLLVICDRCAYHKILNILKGLGYLLSSGNLSNTFCSRTVGKNNDIPCKIRRMST